MDANLLYSLGLSLLAKSREDERRLPPEERERRAEARRLAEEERYRSACITQGLCPGCKGRLIRGKKNKKNDYKRDWNCPPCGVTHSL